MYHPAGKWADCLYKDSLLFLFSRECQNSPVIFQHKNGGNADIHTLFTFN